MSNNIIIEAELMDEEFLNEAVILKFVSKEDVPEEFKKFSVGLVKDLQDACGNKKLKGPGLMAASYGISFGNIVEKMEKKEKKNLYTIRMSVRAANAATKDQRKDSTLSKSQLRDEWIKKTFEKNGLKRVSDNKDAYEFGYWKQGKGCIYGVDSARIDGAYMIYIRCLQDIPENKEILAGGKKNLKEFGIFSECIFM